MRLANIVTGTHALLYLVYVQEYGPPCVMFSDIVVGAISKITGLQWHLHVQGMATSAA